MSECVSQYFFINDSFKLCSDFKDEFITSGSSYYEVIRVINGKCIFLNDHLARFSGSVVKSGKNYDFNKEYYKNIITSFLSKNNLLEGNIKLVINFRNTHPDIYIYRIKHKYPGENEYKYGVKTGLFFAKRKNPNIKYIDAQLRNQINSEIKKTGVYELLLVNNENCITEGSRSNVFFVKDNKVYTSPDDDVLPGITRDYVIKICKELSIKLIYNNININKLNNIDAAFMTGTSPKVLPINSIDKISFNPESEITLRITKAYDEIIEEFTY